MGGKCTVMEDGEARLTVLNAEAIIVEKKLVTLQDLLSFMLTVSIDNEIHLHLISTIDKECRSKFNLLF